MQVQGKVFDRHVLLCPRWRNGIPCSVVAMTHMPVTVQMILKKRFLVFQHRSSPKSFLPTLIIYIDDDDVWLAKYLLMQSGGELQSTACFALPCSSITRTWIKKNTLWSLSFISYLIYQQHRLEARRSGILAALFTSNNEVHYSFDIRNSILKPLWLLSC